MIRSITLISMLLVLAACAASPKHDSNVELFTARADQVGFVNIHMVAREVHREGAISRVEFMDERPEKGEFISKDVFRLRSLASLAKYRGYQYFAILEVKGSVERTVGFLDSQEANYAELFGGKYAKLPKEGVLNIDDIKPLGE